MKHLSAAVLTVIIASAGPGLAQTAGPGAPQQGQARPGISTPGAQAGRPNVQVVPQGTAQITGRIASTEGRPLRGARVSVFSSTYRKSWGGRSNPDGTFEVAKLPAGDYMLTAMKPGYVNMEYGSKKSNGAGRTVHLADGQRLEKIDFQLPRACVITGHVLDEYGEPAGGVTVEVLKFLAVGGARRLLSTDGDQTNDLGQFRVYDVNPGDYYVRATLRNRYRESDDRFAYPATFYPGVTSTADAVTVPCRAGQETQGIHLSLGRVSSANVSGQVIDSQGKPVRATVMLLPPNEVMLGMLAPSATRADGSFTISNVTAGAYRLTAMTMPAGIAPGSAREFATVDLGVGERDVTNLVLPLGKGATARGRLVADKDAAFDFPLDRVRVGTAVDFDAGLLALSGSTQVKDDGTFEIPGLTGSKRLQAYGFPDSWMLKAIRSKDGDVTEQRVTFTGTETVDGFEVVLTNRVTAVTGTVTDDQQRPVKDYAVGIFSDDPAHWGISPGRMTIVRSDDDGRYSVRGLMPGRYLAVAMPELDRDEFGDTEYLERLRPLATPITLAEGEAKTLDLRLRAGQ